MELTMMAEWLNQTFSSYDQTIFLLLHQSAEMAGGFLTPLMRLITLLGEKGLLLFLTAAVLMCFSQTRKTGICLFGAVCCGALITNIILKDWIARPRPFDTLPLYREWWDFVGAPAEDGFSFPSGHMTATAAGMTALSLMKGRKYVCPAIFAVLLMGISRNYLMAHYPSDVLAATVIGMFSAGTAFLITRGIYWVLVKYRENGICRFVLEFDVRQSRKTRL